MSPHQVAIVLDLCFGEALHALSDRMHVWVVESPANRPVIDQIWEKAWGYSLEQGVTSFQQNGESPEERFSDVLGNVDVHHGEMSHDPPWTVLHCYGIENTAPVRGALAEFGVDRIEESPDHFVASRPCPSRR
jgi:hypothetical protein